MKVPLAALAGFVSGVCVTFYACVVRMPPTPPRYELQRPLDLERTYFFGPSEASVHGVLQPGSEVELEGRHSNAAYLVVRTVIDADLFAQIVRPAHPQHAVPSTTPTVSGDKKRK